MTVDEQPCRASEVSTTVRRTSDGWPHRMPDIRRHAVERFINRQSAVVNGLNQDQAVAAATRSIAKHSMTSPTLMSLNVAKPMPHSRPDLTSDTSSLKRRSDPILPS